MEQFTRLQRLQPYVFNIAGEMNPCILHLATIGN